MRPHATNKLPISHWLYKMLNSLLLPLLALSASSSVVFSQAQRVSFHNAPASAQAVRNPYSGQPQAAQAGKKIYTRNCGSCHGVGGVGSGNVPPLAHGAAQKAPDGAIFWYITRGDADNGMPSCAGLPNQQRWHVITYIKSLNGAQPVGVPQAGSVALAAGAKSNAPPPTAPIT